MHTKPYNISPALTPTPLSPSSFAVSSFSSIPRVHRYESELKTLPNKVIRENLCRPVSKLLNKRTQFHNHKTALNVCLKTTYINPSFPSRKQSNPFPRPHPDLPHASFAVASLLSMSRVNQHKSPSKPTPNRKITQNPCKSVSSNLKERSQFHTPKHDLNSCLKTSYIICLSPSPERTNPILFAPRRPTPTSKPNPNQTRIKARPNRIRTRPRAAALHTSCPSLHITPLFPVQNCFISASKLLKTVQNAPIFAKKRSKSFKNASKNTLILPFACAKPLENHHFAQAQCAPIITHHSSTINSEFSLLTSPAKYCKSPAFCFRPLVYKEYSNA